MDNKLIDKANEEINETFVLFKELIKNFNKEQMIKEDEELQEIISDIQKAEVKDE